MGPVFRSIAASAARTFSRGVAARGVIGVGLALIVALGASGAAAETILVPRDHATIQAAMDASTHGAEIIVSPGTYVENIHFDGKNIILRSTEPTNPSLVAATLIDGAQAGSVVTFSGAELSTCVLSGLTITGGDAYDGGFYHCA